MGNISNLAIGKDGNLIVTDYENGVFCLNSNSGNNLWQYPSYGSKNSLIVDKNTGYIYILNYNKTTYLAISSKII